MDAAQVKPSELQAEVDAFGVAGFSRGSSDV